MELLLFTLLSYCRSEKAMQQQRSRRSPKEKQSLGPYYITSISPFSISSFLGGTEASLDFRKRYSILDFTIFIFNQIEFRKSRDTSVPPKNEEMENQNGEIEMEMM